MKPRQRSAAVDLPHVLPPRGRGRFARQDEFPFIVQIGLTAARAASREGWVSYNMLVIGASLRLPRNHTKALTGGAFEAQILNPVPVSAQQESAHLSLRVAEESNSHIAPDEQVVRGRSECLSG